MYMSNPDDITRTRIPMPCSSPSGIQSIVVPVILTAINAGTGLICGLLTAVGGGTRESAAKDFSYDKNPFGLIAS